MTLTDNRNSVINADNWRPTGVANGRVFMTAKAEIMHTLNKLSEDDQAKLLEFIGTLPSAKAAAAPRKSAFGMFEHLGVNITREMIDEARKEAWANFPREFPQGENG